MKIVIVMDALIIALIVSDLVYAYLLYRKTKKRMAELDKIFRKMISVLYNKGLITGDEFSEPPNQMPH